MQLSYSFCQAVLSVANCNEESLPLVQHNPRRVCRYLPGRPMAHIYDMENMVLKKVKLFCQFLMENFGDLVILVFVIILG